MKRRILTLLLTLTMICSLLVACGGSESSNDDKPSKDDVNVEVGDSTTEEESETEELELSEDEALAEQIKTGNPNYGTKVYDETLIAEAIAVYEKYRTDNGYEYCHMFEVEGADVPACIVKKAGGYGAEGPGQVIIYVNKELQVIDKVTYISVNDRGYIDIKWEDYDTKEGETNYYKWENGEFVKYACSKQTYEDEHYKWTYYLYENGVETEVYSSAIELAYFSTGGYYTFYGDGNWYESVQEGYDALINSRELMIGKFKELNEDAAESYINTKEIYDAFK